jgi:pyruvate formate lyase activating enzyme
MKTVAEVLDEMTIESMDLAETLPDNALRCYACAHRCLIREGRRGICQVRYNQGGKLRVPWGYVAGLQADPIEKKPFYHVLSGNYALTFGMLGCDFHCANCQNWVSSQFLRDPAADASIGYLRRISPEQIVKAAKRAGAPVIASSYNEPLITSEWAVSIFKLAVEQGIKCVYVSNGNATSQALEYLRPYLSGYKVDLKTMRDKQYRQLGGVLNNVLDTIRKAHELGLWVEVVTLVIPGFNDSTEELLDAGRFITSISPDIPWHVTAFHPDYKMTESYPTPVKTLQRAAEIGQESGLKFVYAGNLPGSLREYENTNCPKCQTLLVQRTGYVIHQYHITETGACPKCGTKIAGIWTDKPESVQIGGWGMPRIFG